VWKNDDEWSTAVGHSVTGSYKGKSDMQFIALAFVLSVGLHVQFTDTELYVQCLYQFVGTSAAMRPYPISLPGLAFLVAASLFNTRALGTVAPFSYNACALGGRPLVHPGDDHDTLAWNKALAFSV